MGSKEEINDALQLTAEQGFPVHILDLEKHRQKPITAKDLEGMVFEFHGKSGVRRYHHSPTRNFLIQNINGKWIYWGKVLIIEQTVSGEDDETAMTSGKYRILEIYDPIYQEQATKHECPPGKGLSYFG